jgi:hypothetical protein
MVDLKRSEITAIENAVAFPRGFGYVLDFSDRTMEEFFEDEFGVPIFDEDFRGNGNSKRNCLKAFLSMAPAALALKVLRTLWERREGMLASSRNPQESIEASANTEPFRLVIERLEQESDAPASDGIDAYTSDRTLEELVADIDRSLTADKPEVAIDHLHTFCMKRIAHLLKTRDIQFDPEEPLHSRFGRYRKVLVAEQNLHPFTDRAMKSAISLFETFNDLRNNHSLAHDNEILGPVEARFVVSTINAVLVLIRALESNRYGE